MSDDFYEGAGIKLVGPYWKDSEGNGKAYRTACGWPNLIIGHIKKGAEKPLRIDQLGGGTIGWCDWDSTKMDALVGP